MDPMIFAEIITILAEKDESICDNNLYPEISYDEADTLPSKKKLVQTLSDT